jgi:hypothetical protein
MKRKKHMRETLIWQENKVEQINKLVKQKEFNKIWETIRNTVRRKETRNWCDA